MSIFLACVIIVLVALGITLIGIILADLMHPSILRSDCQGLIDQLDRQEKIEKERMRKRFPRI